MMEFDHDIEIFYKIKFLKNILKVLYISGLEEAYTLYKIGSSKPVKVMYFIYQIEESLIKIVNKEMLPIQPEFLNRTWTDVESLKENFNYKPSTPIKKGVSKFIKWYKSYCN